MNFHKRSEAPLLGVPVRDQASECPNSRRRLQRQRAAQATDDEPAKTVTAGAGLVGALVGGAPAAQAPPVENGFHLGVLHEGKIQEHALLVFL